MNNLSRDYNLEATMKYRSADEAPPDFVAGMIAASDMFRNPFVSTAHHVPCSGLAWKFDLVDLVTDSDGVYVTPTVVFSENIHLIYKEN